MVTATACNEPVHAQGDIRLDEGCASWRLHEGVVDVFAADDCGARVFLFRLPTGGQLVAQAVPSGPVRLLAQPSAAAVLEIESAPPDAGELSGWTERLAEAAGLDPHASYGTVINGLHALLVERETARLRRIDAKIAADEAGLQSAISALSNPSVFHQDGSGSSSSALFRACDLVARASGITLVYPDIGLADRESVESIARASGAKARQVPLPSRWWTRDRGPLLGYWRGLPVALLPDQSGRYRMVEPSSGVSSTVDGRLAADLDERAISFSASLPPGAVSRWTLADFGLRGSRADLLRVAVYSAAAGTLGLFPSLLMAWFADSVLPAGDAGQLAIVAAALIVSAVCSALLTFGAGLSLERAGARAGSRCLSGVWERVLSLPTTFFRRFDPADLTMRIIGLDRVRESLTSVVVSISAVSLFAVGHLAVIAHFAPYFLLPTLAIVAAIAVASVAAARLTFRSQAAIAESEARASRTVLEAIQGVRKLRVAGAESRAFAAWSRDFVRGRAESVRARSATAGVSALHAAAPLAGWILVAFVAGADPDLRQHPASLLAFAASFQRLLAAALQLSELTLTMAHARALLDRLSPILTAALESPAGSSTPGVLTGRVELRNIVFRYDAGGPAVLNGVSLRIEPGEFVAIVGASGCGKSTLLRLLLGFEKPQSGAVLFDDRDLASLDLASVRRRLGVVLQDGRILTGDVRSNILGPTGLSMEAAWDAAESAGIASDIRALPMGMQTQLSEGGRELSGGQRQRILIARALVHKPRLLVFDEATAALDNQTQAAVTAAIEQLRATRVVVAHRLSTIRSADRIIVLEAGGIAEEGSYDTLMARRGRFYDLARRQNV